MPGYAQQLQQVSRDSKYVGTHEQGENEQRFNADKETPNKRAYLGRAGNLSMRASGESGNIPRLRTAATLQKARRRK